MHKPCEHEYSRDVCSYCNVIELIERVKKEFNSDAIILKYLGFYLKSIKRDLGQLPPALGWWLAAHTKGMAAIGSLTLARSDSRLS